MMRTIALVWGAVMALAGCSGLQYSKSCSDGVCTVTKNGVTTYEGDPQKVAQLQAKQQAAQKAVADRQRKIDAAARRSPSEPVKVALLPASGADPELAGLAPTYTKLIRREFGSDPRVALVPADEVGRALGMLSRTRDSRLSPATKDLLTLRQVGGLDADVCVFYRLKPETKTGFISGGRGNGAGLAEVHVVRFEAEAASAYFPAGRESRPLSALGRSSNGIALAGLDKHGKAQSAELKGKRDPKLDLEAIRGLNKEVLAELIKAQASLPTAEAIAKIDGAPGEAVSAAVNESLDKLRNFFGGAKR